MNDEPTDLVVQDHQAPTLFHSNDPVEVVRKATDVAKALSSVLEQRKLYKTIQGRKHVLVEGWTLLGTMLGVFPVVEWTRKTPEGWEARVIARTMNGQTIGAAEASCSRDEKTWSTRDDYALRSMAQTRATAKALRGPLGFVVSLAGYEATPEAEMPPMPPQRQERPALEPEVMPEGPAGLSHVKQQLHEELLAWPEDKRDAVVQACSMIREDDGSPAMKNGKPVCVESLEKMLMPRISDKWAGATLAKVREMKVRIAAQKGVA